MSKPVALVTCSEYPRLTASDRHLAKALKDSGVLAVPADWRDPSVPWQDFAIAVLRSTWDYHLLPAEFARWLDHAATVTRLVNSVSLVRWNSNKRYLAELAAKGIEVLPFRLVEPGESAPPTTSRGWDDLVVKPLVGASAWRIARGTPSNLGAILSPELRQSGYLVQPYAREVEKGEYSLVYFCGRFSHAVLKKPLPGDFRSQREHGGTHGIVHPGSFILDAAARVLQALPEHPLFARIDGIVQNGRFVLMEAELIEPELFFELYPQGAKTFARTLLAQLTK